jgi:putative hydrolase
VGSPHAPWRVAVDRVIYLLDRDLAPVSKVRAFTKARALLDHLEPDQVEVLASAGRLQSIEGIGPSIDAVIRGAYGLGPTDYLDQLEASTAIEPEAGAELRAALKGDCHSHSTWSDGGAELPAMAEAAMAIGHEYLVATDHSARLTVAKGLSPQRLTEQMAEIDALNAELAPFRILTGMEVDILTDGSLDLPDEFLARLDVVVASVHHEIHMPEAAMTKRLVTAVANPHVDILGHCTNRKMTEANGRRLGKGRKPSSFDADYVFAACAQFGTAIEINCRPERQDPPDALIELALEWDCRISIDSDAHAPGQLEWVTYGCDRAAALDIEADRIINTRSAEDLLALVA